MARSASSPAGKTSCFAARPASARLPRQAPRPRSSRPGHSVRFTTLAGALAGLLRSAARRCRRSGFVYAAIPRLSFSSATNSATSSATQARPICSSASSFGSAWPLTRTSLLPSGVGLPQCRVRFRSIDRLLHRAELLDIDADSYRLEEANERARKKAATRSTKRRAAGT